MTTELVASTAQLLLDQVTSADDKLIRVELGPSWPIDDLIVELRSGFSALRIGVLQNLDQYVLDPDVLRDPAVLTKMRNRRKKSTAPVPLVLFGTATGRNEAGLQKISVIISRNLVASAWFENVNDDLARRFSGGNLVFRRQLAEFVAGRLGAGIVRPGSADTYMARIVDPATESAVLQDKLYEIGLVPDHGLATHASGTKGGFARRMEQNQNVLDLLSGLTGDLKKAANLSTSSKESAKALSRWRTSHAIADLEAAELVETLEILGKTSSRSPTPKKKIESVLEGLGNPDRTFEQRSRILAWASSVLAEDGHLRSEVVGEYEDEVGSCELVVTAPAKLDERWLVEHEAPDDDDLPTKSERQNLIRLEVVKSEAKRTAYVALDDSTLAESLKFGPEVLSAYSQYLDSRSEMVEGFRLLSCSDLEVLTLLVASSRWRASCSAFITAWKQLLSAGNTVGGINKAQSLELLALLDAMWTRACNR